MLQPRFYNKRLRKLLLILLLLFLILLFNNSHLLKPSISQSLLQHQALELHRSSDFNPRDITNDIYTYILQHQIPKPSDDINTRIGNNSGVYFHWDDWVDLSPADKILQKYREKFPEGICDDKMEKFAKVNAYYLETYQSKVFRGLVNLYCSFDIPTRIIVPLNDSNYVELPVAGKKRISYRELSLNTSKTDLLKLMSQIDLSSFHGVNEDDNKFPLRSYHVDDDDDDTKNKTWDLSISDFEFDPFLKIKELESKNDPKDSQYLEFLKFANDYVDNADRFFKYPWIIDDVISGNSHHFAYPFFKRYITDRERHSVLHHMVRAWFHFALVNSVPSWINFGSLLGWIYNGVNMPWDTDIDIQIPIVHFDRLSRELNNSLVLEDPRYGNLKYHFIVSPTYIRHGNGRNFVDGRFIDTNSGLYIDLSTLVHIETDTPPPSYFLGFNNGNNNGNDTMAIHCKNWNWLSLDELSPLRQTYFEGSSIYIPHNVTQILSRKYGLESYTTSLNFNNHNYQKDIQLWVPDEICPTLPKDVLNRFIDPQSKSELTLAGACDDPHLKDEYHIVHEYAQRHLSMNSDPDNDNYGDDDDAHTPLKDLPMFRKDAWDYYHDLDIGVVENDDWYYRMDTI